MIYMSVSNPRIKELSKLKDKRQRDLTGTFLIEGEHSVLEAHKKSLLKEVFIKEKTTFVSDVPVHVASESVMKALSHLETAPSMIGVCIKPSQNQIGEKIVVLENIQDPGNMGTIIRSAVAFGADTIILTKECADVYSPKVLRATQGMIFHISVLVGEMEDFIKIIKQKEIPLLGTKVNGGNHLKTVEKFSKFAIIMGNEGSGLTEKTLAACDSFIYIEIEQECESLNVGVATSIILYELYKRV